MSEALLELTEFQFQISNLSEMTNNPLYSSLLRLYADDNDINSLLDLEGTEFIQKFNVFHLRRNKLKSVCYHQNGFNVQYLNQ